MAFKPTYVRRKTVFRYIFCVLNVYQNIYNLSYIELETEINFKNAVTLVLVKLGVANAVSKPVLIIGFV